MWASLIIFFTLRSAVGIQFGEKIKSWNAKDQVINPNDWSRDWYLKDEGGSEGTPYDGEILLAERQSRALGVPRSSAEKTSIEYITVRRFINLLLKRAHFEDVDGNPVPLESMSSSQSDRLVMSFAVYANPLEIQMLLESEEKGVGLRRIDEILTNLASSPEPDLPLSQRCNYWHLLQNWWPGLRDAALEQIDLMVVLYILTVSYILWTVAIVLNGGGSWKGILLCFVLPSLLWEFSKSLHEEKLKQYSDNLRLGSIPDHCLGWDQRRWWEVLLSSSDKEQCREYHLSKMSHPVFRVSIFKVAVNHLDQLLGIFTNFIKDLTASSPGDGFFKDILMRSGAWFFTMVALVACFYIYLSVPSRRPTERAPSRGGTRVEPVELAVEAPVEPPPRRKKRSGRGAAAPKILADAQPKGDSASGDTVERVLPSEDLPDGCVCTEGDSSEEGAEGKEGVT